MWEKILAQLISKNPGVSKAVLTLIAKKLAEKVTEENQIEGAITEFEANSTISIKDYADFVQKEGDSRVGEAKKKWDQENKKPEPGKEDQPPAVKKDEIPNEMPPWAKEMQDSIAKLSNQVTVNKSNSTMEDLVAKPRKKEFPRFMSAKQSLGKISIWKTPFRN